MPRSFVKIYLDFDERTEELNEIEKGRLLLALVRYARTGEKPDLKGNERFCFSNFKSTIDHDVQVYNSKLSNGNKGGRPAQEKPETESNLTKPNQTESNRTEPNETEHNLNAKKEDIRQKKEDKDEDKDKELTSGALAPRARRKPTLDALSSLAPEVQEAFRDFVAMRVKMRKPMTDKAIALAVNKLLSVAGDDPAQQVATINRTVEHGWQTFYPDDRRQASQQTTRSQTSNPFLAKLMEMEAEERDQQGNP